MSRLPALALALILIAVTACGSQPAPTPVVQTVEVTRLVPVTLTPEPTVMPTELPPVIAESTFDSGPGEWFTGSWENASAGVSDGQLVIEISAVDWAATSGHPDLDYLNAPFDLTMTIAPLDDQPNSYAGVRFRWVDDSNYAEFAVNGAAQVDFGVLLDGEWYEIIPFSRQTALTRASNVIRLVDDGKRVTAYANGEVLFNIPFVDLASGGVAVTVGTYAGGASARWAFDDIVVREVGP